MGFKVVSKLSHPSLIVQLIQAPLGEITKGEELRTLEGGGIFNIPTSKLLVYTWSWTIWYAALVTHKWPGFQIK